MTDKEVGEIWSRLIDPLRPGDRGFYTNDCMELVKKLVEDRQTLYWHEFAKRLGGTNPQEALRAALRDFGISLEDWK